LAHIKHILPEAVKFEYVKCWDSDLQRNKWDLCSSLLLMPEGLLLMVMVMVMRVNFFGETFLKAQN
jgi:hypothetical protein